MFHHLPRYDKSVTIKRELLFEESLSPEEPKAEVLDIYKELNDVTETPESR
jgi:hypothetical protein